MKDGSTRTADHYGPKQEPFWNRNADDAQHHGADRYENASDLYHANGSGMRRLYVGFLHEANCLTIRGLICDTYSQ